MWSEPARTVSEGYGSPILEGRKERREKKAVLPSPPVNYLSNLLLNFLFLGARAPVRCAASEGSAEVAVSRLEVIPKFPFF